MFVTFNEIKKMVANIIESHTHINDEYTGSMTGIYMLYVDDFSDCSVIPIYVGKTVNFKQRLKQHRRDIDKINKTPFTHYLIGFLRGVYGMRCSHEGKYKACKIFKYMVEHNCVWKDLRMIILELCEKEELADREKYWIENLRPAYVGFNQIDSITLQRELKDNPQQYKCLVLSEAELFRQYLDYGYSVFNYIHAFANNPHNPYKAELDQRAKQHVSGVWTTEDGKNLAETFCLLCGNYEKEYNLVRPIIEERYALSIHECFKNCKIKSKAREQEVIDLMVSSDPYNVIPEVFRTKEYLRYYMTRNKASRACGEMIDEFIKSQSVELDILTSHVKESYMLWVEHMMVSLVSSKHGLIFPGVLFGEMPLGEMQ